MNKKTLFRRLTITITVLLVLAVLASLGISFYVGNQLIHPKRKPITQNPRQVNLNYSPVTFQSKTDSVTLKGWIIPADSSVGRMVIEAHGYRDNRSDITASLPVARILHENHISVLLFDFRASGVSGGKLVTVGQNETGDLLGAVDYVRSLGFKKIGVIGYSMGASTALIAAADDTLIRAVIADSPFANLSDYLTTHLPLWSGLPAWPFTPEIIWEIRLFYGLNPANVDPEEKLRHWEPRPLLLIAGTGDDKIPYQNSVNLYNIVRHNPQDSLWLVPGAGHVKAYSADSKQYLNNVSRFFNRYLN